MSYFLCAISIEKVQSFLFDAIQSHEQQKQEDEYTLRKIRAASKAVSKTFQEKVIKVFGSDMVEVRDWSKSSENRILPAGSGMVLFVVSSEEKDYLDTKIYDFFSSFFRELYRQYKALMRISYEQIAIDDITDSAELLSKIKNIKGRLKSSTTFSKVIDESKNTLFQFQKGALDSHEFVSTPKSPFAENFSVLRPENDKTEDNRFHIAFLKADLNGMGLAFRNVCSMQDYKNMSDILNDWVCESGIAKAINFVNKDIGAKEGMKIYPLYAAGDDIFFACKVNDIARAIKVLDYLLNSINAAFRRAKIKIEDRFVQLQMRVGLDISYANQPIRYYYHRADDAMETGKNSCELVETIRNRGSITVFANAGSECVGGGTSMSGVPLVLWDKADGIDDALDNLRKEEKEYEIAKEKLKEKQVDAGWNNWALSFLDVRNAISKAGFDADKLPGELSERYKRYKKKRGGEIKDINSYKVEVRKINKKYENTLSVRKELQNPSSYFLWEGFLNDVATLNFIADSKSDKKEGKLAVTTHLHNVLSSLEAYYGDLIVNGDNASSSRLLYSLLPVRLTEIGTGRDTVPEETKAQYKKELTLWHLILQKLFFTVENEEKKKENKIINAEQLAKLISYMKLLLTFVSPHFEVTVERDEKEIYENAEKLALEEKDKWLDKIVLEHLYKWGKSSGRRDLFCVFIERNRNQRFTTKDGVQFADFITMRSVEKSMLYRFKKLLRSHPERAYELAMSMIGNNIDASAQAEAGVDANISKDSEVKRKIENARIRRLKDANFDGEKLCRMEKNKSVWNEDFIDGLIVFYSYYNLRNRLRDIFGTKNNAQEQ